MATPWSGYNGGAAVVTSTTDQYAGEYGLNIGDPNAFIVSGYPNPFKNSTALKYRVNSASEVTINIYDMKGQLKKTLVNEYKSAGTYETVWNAENAQPGMYLANIIVDGVVSASVKLSLAE
jgi:hypothetical protein